MKCLNMRISEVLFFILNFAVIHQMNADENKTFPRATSISVPPSSVDQGCPQLLKMIRDNNLTDYKVNCSPLNTNNEINIENILQQACVVVGNMLNFICDKKLNVTTDLFKRNDSDSICPFNFSHLERLNFRLTNYKMLNELQNQEHCSKVCTDLYSKRPLCVLLSKLNHFLKSFTLVTPSETFSPSKVNSPPVETVQNNIASGKISDKTLVKPKVETEQNKVAGKTEQDKIAIKTEQNKIAVKTEQDKIAIKTEQNKIAVKTEQDKIAVKTEQDKIAVKTEEAKLTLEGVPERIGVKPKVETSSSKLTGTIVNPTKLVKDNINDKNLAVNSVPEVEQNSDHKTELCKSVVTSQEINDPENKNLDEEKDSDNQEDISSLGDLYTEKAEISPNLSNMESSDVRIDSSFKQKEIYSGDGFFTAEDSHFFFYLIMVLSIIVIGYIAFHNKNKILAYALEGTSGRRNRRRPNSSRYRKLETNLEEVISSSTTHAAASNVVY